MSIKFKENLIIGAGPAGMACAMELHNAGKNFILVDKSDSVGGLSKTYQFGEFKTDNGPHRFFSKNQYLYDFIEDLLKEKWIKVNRFTRFYIKGKFYQYPVEWRDALPKLGPINATKFLTDYLIAKIKYRGAEPKNFEEFIVSQFGRSLAEFNMLNYTEKLWGLPCSKLSADWAEQRIKGLSVSALLKNMFLKKKGPKTLVDQFYYPELGTGLIYETIKNKIEKKNRVILDNEPVKIIHKNNVIKKVKMKKGKSFSPQNLISSIPINRFVEILDPKPPANVLKALKKLKFRSQVYLFLTVNKPFIAKDQWIYFPETHIPLGRMSEMKNFSQKMSPRDKTSLFIEFFCWEGDETWKMKKEELIKISLDWLERLGFVKKEEVIDSYHLKQKNVYPVYDVGYKENLAVVKNYLDTFKNLIYIGRPGRFKYTNQDHSLEMGILAAKSIIENKKLNVEDVGTEKEYFEKGIIR